MNAKERFYSGLAKETIGKITSNTDNWTSFLRTMSRNYEFTYPEQVMIYAQRPNATFCKPSDQLHLPVPEAKFETVVVQPSEYQKDMVASLSERAADVHAGIVDPSVDNMLKITSDGRKLGLDQRLMNTLLPDDPDSKLNACVGNILRIWQDGQADKLTQLVFCDLSTPKNDGTFNVYDDVKTKLIANGVPAEEVAFIHDADTEAKKKDLFAYLEQMHLEQDHG